MRTYAFAGAHSFAGAPDAANIPANEAEQLAVHVRDLLLSLFRWRVLEPQDAVDLNGGLALWQTPTLTGQQSGPAFYARSYAEAGGVWRRSIQSP